MTEAIDKADVKRKTQEIVSAYARQRAEETIAAMDLPPTETKVANNRTRSTGVEQSITRILDAAMESASRQGLRNLSMSDVCRIAGVARGTLYRYFPSKEALLESLGQRTRQQTEAGIRAAAACATNGNECLQNVINFLVNFSLESRAQNILEIEPQFFMEFISRNLPIYVRLLSECLGAFFDELDGSLGVKVDRKILSEMILRLQISYIFVPGGGSREDLMKKILRALDAIK